jgi:hypothetical protein
MKKDEKKKEGSGKSSVAVIPKGGLPVTVDLAKDSGLGFETADRDAYMIPFLVILQTNSPQCAEGDSSYIKGAKTGSFYNTATKEIFDGKEGVFVLPCAYQQKFVEWVPRDQGGGFRGEHDKAEVLKKAYPRDDSGRWSLPNGNYLADVHYHFCIQITKTGPRMIVLGLTSTQLKPSREWMTAMTNWKVKDAKGNDKPAPMMAILSKLTTVDKANEKGRWKLLKTEVERLIDRNDPTEVRYYLMGKEFHDQVVAGKARAEEPIGEDFQTDAPF